MSAAEAQVTQITRSHSKPASTSGCRGPLPSVTQSQSPPRPPQRPHVAGRHEGTKSLGRITHSLPAGPPTRQPAPPGNAGPHARGAADPSTTRSCSLVKPSRRPLTALRTPAPATLPPRFDRTEGTASRPSPPQKKRAGLGLAGMGKFLKLTKVVAEQGMLAGGWLPRHPGRP